MPMQRDEYDAKLSAEGDKWGKHLDIEAQGEWHAWLDHPLVAEHYRERGRVEGLAWERWVEKQFGGAAERSLDLGCGSASRSILLCQAGLSKYAEGADVSRDRIAEAERIRLEAGIRG